MLIARELRKKNIAEYILYMWQVEDLLRACSFEVEQIENKLVSRFQADENSAKEISEWYHNLALMMEKEHIREKGHLQVLVNLVNDLNEFHQKLIETQADGTYLQLYGLNRQAISELVQKSGGSVQSEVEACLNALYGVLLMKLKEIEISSVTRQTVEGFGRMIGHLSARYIQFENDDFDF